MHDCIGEHNAATAQISDMSITNISNTYMNSSPTLDVPTSSDVPESYFSWKTINELHSTHQKQSSDINTLKLNDGTQASCPISISNTLNEYFSSIGVSMGNGIRPTNTSFTTFMKSISQSFVLDGTCVEEIIACITNLKNTSSSGIDGLSTKFLKMAKGTIAPILAKLFNKSMESG